MRPLLSSRPGRFAARFARADRGSTAVEFSLVALPFVMLIFATIELALVMLVCTTLDTAVEAAGRKIRTGEFQESGAATKSDFKAVVCARMTWLSSDCANNAYVDVRTFSNFAGLAANSPQAASSFNAASTCFTAGNPTDIVLVRIYYKWRLFTPLLDVAMENMGAGSGFRLLSTATAFRNEPYNDNLPVGAHC